MILLTLTAASPLPDQNMYPLNFWKLREVPVIEEINNLEARSKMDDWLPLLSSPSRQDVSSTEMKNIPKRELRLPFKTIQHQTELQPLQMDILSAPSITFIDPPRRALDPPRRVLDPPRVIDPATENIISLGDSNLPFREKMRKIATSFLPVESEGIEDTTKLDEI